MEALQHPWLSGKPGPKADRLPTGDMAEHIARPPRQPRTEDILEVTPPSSNPMRPTPRPKTASTVRPSFQANAQANTQAGHGPEELGKVQSAKTKQGAPWKGERAGGPRPREARKDAVGQDEAGSAGEDDGRGEGTRQRMEFLHALWEPRLPGCWAYAAGLRWLSIGYLWP